MNNEYACHFCSEYSVQFNLLHTQHNFPNVNVKIHTQSELNPENTYNTKIIVENNWEWSMFIVLKYYEFMFFQSKFQLHDSWNLGCGKHIIFIHITKEYFVYIHDGVFQVAWINITIEKIFKKIYSCFNSSTFFKKVRVYSIEFG